MQAAQRVEADVRARLNTTEGELRGALERLEQLADEWKGRETRWFEEQEAAARRLDETLIELHRRESEALTLRTDAKCADAALGDVTTRATRVTEELQQRTLELQGAQRATAEVRNQLEERVFVLEGELALAREQLQQREAVVEALRSEQVRFQDEARELQQQLEAAARTRTNIETSFAQSRAELAAAKSSQQAADAQISLLVKEHETLLDAQRQQQAENEHALHRLRTCEGDLSGMRLSLDAERAAQEDLAAQLIASRTEQEALAKEVANLNQCLAQVSETEVVRCSLLPVLIAFVSSFAINWRRSSTRVNVASPPRNRSLLKATSR